MMIRAKTYRKVTAKRNMAFLNQIHLYLVVAVVTPEKHFIVWNRLITREKPTK